MSGIYMYRKGEAKLFASPEDVPQGKGWVDSPAKIEAEPEAKPAKPRGTLKLPKSDEDE